jgi:fructokinase
MQAQRRPDVVCWGELLWDLFPSGALLGGAPSNVALHLAGQDVRTALITRLGSDELGRRAHDALDRRGVIARGVQFDEEMQTGRVGITVHEGEPIYTLHDGAWQRIGFDERGRELLSACRALCFGTLSQEKSAGLASWREALDTVAGDCLVVCDPNLRGGRMDVELVREHMRAASVVKINDVEAAAIEDRVGVPSATAWLIDDMEVELVAQTHGPGGATLVDTTGQVHHPGIPATPGGDNVGAGDAFVATLVRGLLGGAELQPIAEAANRCGSFVAGQRGATPMLPSELRRTLDELLGPAYS